METTARQAQGSSTKDRVPTVRGFQLPHGRVVVKCVFCGSEHYHATPEPGRTRRISHCQDWGKRSEYAIALVSAHQVSEKIARRLVEFELSFDAAARQLQQYLDTIADG